MEATVTRAEWCCTASPTNSITIQLGTVVLFHGIVLVLSRIIPYGFLDLKEVVSFKIKIILFMG